MNVQTGYTVTDIFLSLDSDNNPVSGTTFNIVTYKNGVTFTGLTVNTSLVDASLGVFKTSWSSNTTGDFQLYIKNNETNVLFVSDTISVLPDSYFENNIYVGL